MKSLKMKRHSLNLSGSKWIASKYLIIVELIIITKKISIISQINK